MILIRDSYRLIGMHEKPYPLKQTFFLWGLIQKFGHLCQSHLLQTKRASRPKTKCPLLFYINNHWPGKTAYCPSFAKATAGKTATAYCHCKLLPLPLLPAFLRLPVPLFKHLVFSHSRRSFALRSIVHTDGATIDGEFG